MKLAILSVYVFGPHMTRLLNIHWKQIRQFAEMPYKILVAAPQCTAEQRELLESQPDIELVAIESPKSVRGNARAENSYNLNCLAEAAMEQQDVSHCLAVHPDSFPIREGWTKDFIDPLSTEPAIASLVPNGYSAGLFWNRSFYETLRPSMLVGEDERESKDFQEFCETHPNIDHIETGLGYLFASWKNNIPWRQVQTTSDRKIYGQGSWFHLVGASWLATRHYRQDWLSRQYLRGVRSLRPWMTESIYHALLRPIELNGFTTRDGSPLTKREELEKLVDDPETYVDHYLQRFAEQEQTAPVEYSAVPPSARMGS